MFRAAGFAKVRTGLDAVRAPAVLIAVLVMGGCSSLGDEMPDFMASSKPAGPTNVAEAAPPQDELQKATEYWGKEYQKRPSHLESALSYAKNLKAMGEKGQALAVLQQASMYHPGDRKLASEYGRLALEFEQISVAEKLLSLADDPTSPDWRVISARGTVKAKQGKYAEAIPYYEKALQLSKDQPSVLNNLALAHAMNGEATKAEDMLRTASSVQGANVKTRQNLALVLGLQGKYDEATRTAANDLSPAAAAENTALVRQIVKLDAKAVSPSGMTAPATALAAAPAVSGLKPTTTAEAAPAPAGGWAAKVASAQPAAPAGGTTAPALPWSNSAAPAAAAAAPVSTGGPAMRPSAN